MAGATLVVGLVLIALAWLGILRESSLRDWQLRLAWPSMLVVMLCRLNLYVGRAGQHHAGGAHSA